jgi:uncharacterized membrane protein
LGSVSWRLALAPIPSLLLFAGLSDLPSTPAADWGDLFWRVLMAAIFMGWIVALLAVAIGLPLYLAYRRLNVTSPILYAVGAASVAALLYAWPTFLPSSPTSTFSFSTRDCRVVIDNVRTACGWDMFYDSLWWNVGYGALAGLVFWLLLRWRAKSVAAT